MQVCALSNTYKQAPAFRCIFLSQKWIQNRAVRRPVHAFNPGYLIVCEASNCFFFFFFPVGVCLVFNHPADKDRLWFIGTKQWSWLAFCRHEEHSVNMSQNVYVGQRNVCATGFCSVRRGCQRCSWPLVKYLICKLANSLKSLRWVAIYHTRLLEIMFLHYLCETAIWWGGNMMLPRLFLIHIMNELLVFYGCFSHLQEICQG